LALGMGLWPFLPSRLECPDTWISRVDILINWRSNRVATSHMELLEDRLDTSASGRLSASASEPGEGTSHGLDERSVSEPESDSVDAPG